MFTTNNLTKQLFSETISWSNILTRGVGTRVTFFDIRLNILRDFDIYITII